MIVCVDLDFAGNTVEDVKLVRKAEKTKDTLGLVMPKVHSAGDLSLGSIQDNTEQTSPMLCLFSRPCKCTTYDCISTVCMF